MKTFTSARTLLGILRLSTALARLRLVNQVSPITQQYYTFLFGAAITGLIVKVLTTENQSQLYAK